MAGSLTGHKPGEGGKGWLKAGTLSICKGQLVGEFVATAVLIVSFCGSGRARPASSAYLHASRAVPL